MANERHKQNTRGDIIEITFHSITQMISPASREKGTCVYISTSIILRLNEGLGKLDVVSLVVVLVN